MKNLVARPEQFKEILEGVRIGTYSLIVKFTEGEKPGPGRYHIPADVELMKELERHLNMKERAWIRKKDLPYQGPSSLDLSKNSGSVRIRRLINPARREVSVNIKLPQDRILYVEPESREHSRLMQRALDVHNEYWAENGPGINSTTLILLLKEEGFLEAQAKYIDMVSRPETLRKPKFLG